MENDECLQCGQKNISKTNRIVQDSCGHFKCRCCLIRDVNQCSTCKILSAVGEPTSVICTSGNVNINNSQDESESSKKKIDCISNEVVTFNTIKKLNFFGKDKVLKTRSERYNNLPPHIKKLGKRDNAEYKCKKCSSIFKDECEVTRHASCAGESGFCCPKCSKKFKKKSKLINHLNVHDGIKKFICQICKAAFYEKSKLVTHGRIHSGVKDHKCSKCESTFYTSSALREHENIHLPSKPYTCQTCLAKFSNLSNLKKHQALHLNLSFHCPACNKKYRTEYALKKHSNVCSLSYECSQCSKSFPTKKDRERHTLSHSSIKKYQCNVCHISFKRKDNVRRHVRNTHPELKAKNGNVYSETTEKGTVVEKPKESFPLVVNETVNHETLQPSIEICNQEASLVNNNQQQLEQQQSTTTCQENMTGPIHFKDTYSLNDLYKKIFIYKDHEQFIPLEHQPCSNNTADESENNKNKCSSKNIQETKCMANKVSSSIMKSIEQSHAYNSNLTSCSKYSSDDSCGSDLIIIEQDLPNHFSKKDIIEANEQRQSVIFNVGSLKNKSKPVIIDKTESVLKHSPCCDDRKAEVSIDMIKEILQTDTSCTEQLSMTNEMDCEEDISKKEMVLKETYNKPIYLHKKVNYDKTAMHQHKQHPSSPVPNKINTNLGNMNQAKEKKNLSKEELTELYKKILVPGYKGDK